MRVATIMSRWARSILLAICALTLSVPTYAFAGMVYWSDNISREINRMDSAGGSAEFLVSGLKSPRGIAIDSANGYLYWTQATPGSITRGRLDGSDAQQIVTDGLLNPVGLALDVAGGKMYWTDTFTDKVQRANLDGTEIEDLVIMDVFNPRGIALDLVNGKVYWAENSPSRIRRADLDGANVEEVPIEPTEHFYASKVALDVASGKIYWTNDLHYLIQRANLDGTNVETLVQPGGTPFAIALDLDAGKMYWSGGAAPGVLRRANLDGSEIEVILERQHAAIHGIAIGHTPIPEPSAVALLAAAAMVLAPRSCHRVRRARVM